MSNKLEIKDFEQLILEVQKEYDNLQKSEAKMKEEVKEEEMKKEDVKAEEPKAEDKMPDVEEKEEEHIEEELEEELHHQSIGELVAEYMGLDEDDLMAHLIAVNQAFAVKMKAEKEKEEMFVEEIMNKNVQNALTLVKKSKEQLQKKEQKSSSKEGLLKKEVESLKSQVSTLTKSLEKISSKAQSQAMTGNNFLAKSEHVVEKTWKRDELIKKLNEKAKDPSLSNEDRLKITKYSLNLKLDDELKAFLNIK